MKHRNVEWGKVAEALGDLENLGYLYPEVEEIARRLGSLLNPTLRDRDWYRGHAIRLDSEGSWVFVSDGVPVATDPDRSCGYCGLANTVEGHDGCLRTLPGVANACCGHGVPSDAYIVFNDGRRFPTLERKNDEASRPKRAD